MASALRRLGGVVEALNPTALVIVGDDQNENFVEDCLPQFAIFVLDPMGNIVDSHQMDGVLPIGNETGLLKAKTALYARTSSAASAASNAESSGAADRP